MASIVRSSHYLLLLGSLLAGCSGTATNNPNNLTGTSNPPATKPLNELKFKDAGLKACVDRVAQEKAWKSVAEFTELKCYGLEKARLFSRNTDQVIHDLSGLENLTALKTLDIPGHFYTQIDTRALKQLETLNLYEAFIKDIDLSQNTHLKKLNLGATSIAKLDLTGLTELQELRVAYKTEGFSISYTEMNIREQGRAYGVNFDTIKSLKKDIRLDKAAGLIIADIGDNGLLDLPSANRLQVAKGQFTTRSLSQTAPNLKTLDVHLSGDHFLDLSQAAALEKASITSNDLSQIKVAPTLGELSISAPLTELIAGKQSTLTELTLTDVQMGPSLDLTYLSNLNKLTIKSTTLHTLAIPNHLKSIDFVGPLEGIRYPAETQLSALTLAPAAAAYLVSNLPASITQLSLTGVVTKALWLDHLNKLSELKLIKAEVGDILVAEAPISVTFDAPNYTVSAVNPAASVIGLELRNLPDDSCSLSRFDYINLQSLLVDACSAKEIALSKAPGLTSVSLSMPNLTTIDFSQNLQLKNISINGGALTHLDLSAFEGKSLGQVTIVANLPNADEASNLVNTVKRNAKSWFLNLGNNIIEYGAHP